MEKNGNPIYAAYRAETGNPTAADAWSYLASVSDPHTSIDTQGPGLCQKGSKWYGEGGYTYTYILNHYYTNVTVQTGGAYYLSSAGCSCGPNGCFKYENWKDTSDGSTFVRSFPVGSCPS